jgi:diguanylate cyclase (GGDEF)-like protein
MYGRIRGGWWFAWSNLFRGLAWLILSDLPFLPRAASVLGNSLLIAGLVLLHRSLAELIGRRSIAWKLQLALSAAVIAGIVYFTWIHPSFGAVMVLESACVAVQFALSTSLLFASIAPGMRGAVWFTGGILFSYAVVEMTRAVAMVRAPGGILSLNHDFLALVLVATILANGGTTFGFLFLSAAQLRRELTRVAERDALTGVLNRRGLKSVVDRALVTAHDAGYPVSAVMLDLDGMKAANDTWGHECGDAILCAVASFLVHTIGQRGAVARLGGDEFLVVLPGASETVAFEIAERLRVGIERLPIAHVRPRASFGVAAMHGASLDEAMRRSDHALYLAKNAGRNQVRCYA